MDLFIQFHYEREVYYERKAKVEFPVAYYTQIVSKNAMLRQTVPKLMKFISQTFPK